MGNNYYSASGKKVGYTGKDIWGNKCFYLEGVAENGV